MSSDFDSFDQDNADGFIQSNLGARSWPSVGTIWANSSTDVFKIDATDFSVDFSNAVFTQTGKAIGGTDRKVWASERLTSPNPDLTRTHELDPTDLSSDRSNDNTLTDTNGIGGSGSVIWISKSVFVELAELRIADFSVERFAASNPFVHKGVGGMGDVIWAVTISLSGSVFKYNVGDLSFDRSGNSPGTSPTGVGGTSNVIYYTDGSTSKSYVLDPTDMSEVRSGGLAYIDIGGI